MFAEHRALQVRRAGPESMAVSGQMMTAVRAKLTRLEPRLIAMDTAGVAEQVVSPSPTHYHHWASPDLARQLWTGANNAIAAFCALAPERFTGLGFVPMQHADQTVEALNHAVLECGLRGVEISSHAAAGQGTAPIELSAKELDPFWARAAELGAVVFVHPLGCTLDERLDRWYLSNVVGQPVENAIALSHVIFGGVLDRHPTLKLVFAHGGGYLPHYLGRADHAWINRSDCRSCLRLPSTYIPQIWFDSLVHDPHVLRELIRVAGVGQIVLGSDYPFDMGIENPVEQLRAAGLPDDVNAAIASGNAVRLGLGVERC